MGCKQGAIERLDIFVTTYQKIWRALDSSIYENMIYEVFKENVLSSLQYATYNHKHEPIMDMACHFL